MSLVFASDAMFAEYEEAQKELHMKMLACLQARDADIAAAECSATDAIIDNFDCTWMYYTYYHSYVGRGINVVTVEGLASFVHKPPSPITFNVDGRLATAVPKRELSRVLLESVQKELNHIKDDTAFDDTSDESDDDDDYFYRIAFALPTSWARMHLPEVPVVNWAEYKAHGVSVWQESSTGTRVQIECFEHEHVVTHP